MERHSLGLALFALFGFIGCSQPNTSEKDAKAPTAADHSHDHPHGRGERDHSVEGHAHGEGPHGGTVADWGGGKFHVEFTVNHADKQATVYILGADEKTPTPIASETIELSIKDPQFQVILTPSPQEGDPQAKASRFIGMHENLGIVQEFAGTMTAVIDGTPYSGDFNEEAHDDHEH